MNLFDYLRQYFYEAYEFWIDVAIECYGSWYVPDALGDLFNKVATAFLYMAFKFADAAEWYRDVAGAIKTILTWDFIWDKIKEYAEPLFEIIKALTAFGTAFGDLVTTWWETTLEAVKELIATAVEALPGLKEAWDSFWDTVWPEFIGVFDTLKGAWDDFVTNTLPNLLDFTKLGEWWEGKLPDIGSLITSTLGNWFPFYDTLASFFINPLDWLEKTFTDWFLGEE